MSDERERIICRLMAIENRLYDYLLVCRVPAWTEIDLTMPQLKVLFLAAGPEPLPTSHAARSLGMTLSTVTGVVDRLVAQGLVQRKESVADRRVVLLTASERGRDLIDGLLSAGLGHLRDLLDRLSVEELGIVARAIDLLYGAAMTQASRQLSAVSDQQTRGRGDTGTRGRGDAETRGKEGRGVLHTPDDGSSVVSRQSSAPSPRSASSNGSEILAGVAKVSNE